MFKDEKNKGVQEVDFKSIEEICSSTWESIYRFIYFKVQNREEAEDLTQETYVRALSYIHKNNIKIEKYIVFLKTIALNIIRDKWRRKKNHGTSVNIDVLNPAETAIEDSTEIAVQREMIEKALDSLNEDQKTAIILRILKGYSVADTGKLMNKNESTVRVLQYRALKALSAKLKNDM